MSDDVDLSTEDAAAEATPSEDVTMEDTIRETLAEIESRGEADTEQKAEPVRDERGRFAAKDATPAVVNESGDPSTPETPQEVAPVVEEKPVSVPPELQRLGLKKEEAEAFQAAPEVLKNAFLRRSEDMHKGLEQFKEKAQIGAAMEQVIAPFMRDIQAVGVTPDVAIRSLLASERALRYGTPEQKIQMLSKLANDYNIPLNSVAEYQASQPQVDPQVQSLQSELQQMRGWIQQQNQQREWNERQGLNSQIDAFAKDPAHTHFEEVRNDMAGLLQAGMASDLKDAYEKAIYANPSVRAKVLAEQQAASAAKAKQEAAEKAQAARSASVVNIRKKGIQPASKPLGSMDDTIREEARRLGLV